MASTADAWHRAVKISPRHIDRRNVLPNLAEKGGRSERDKLDRRRSTKFIIPPNSDARPLVYRTDRQALSTARFCHTSSFCTVAWQLARCQLTRRIALFLCDS